MNRKKEERNKLICDLYHDGKTIREISEIIKLKKAPLMTILKRDYNLYYTDAFISPSEKIKIKSEKLKEEFLKIYQPFRYSRAEICRKLNCKESQFEHMLNMYNLTHLRLKTYKSQKTLCNVPDEFFNEIKEYCNKHGMSVRKLAVTAINEYILKNEINKNDLL